MATVLAPDRHVEAATDQTPCTATVATIPSGEALAMM